MKLNEPCFVRFLEDWRAMDTHWTRGRSVQCGPPMECPKDVHRTGVIWKAFAAVEVWFEREKLWFPKVLEITENLGELLPATDLRGQVWHLERTFEKKKMEPVNGVHVQTLHPKEVPPTFDIEPVLKRLFRCDKLYWGAVCQVPARLLVEPSQGAPPPRLDLGDNGKPKIAAETWKQFQAERLKVKRAAAAADK